MASLNKSKAVDTIADSIIKALDVKMNTLKTELKKEMNGKSYLPTVYSNDNGKITVANTTTGSWEKVKLLDETYPVGSIYSSSVNTNPSGIVGGTWIVIDYGITGIYYWQRTA